MEQKKSFGLNSSNTIVTVVFLVLGFFALYWVATSIFKILAFISPILLVITLIMDYKIVLNYGKWILNLFKTNLLGGIAASVLTVVGFPIVCFLLFGRAMLGRKAKQLQDKFKERQEGTFADFEILEDDADMLELPPLEKRVDTEDSEYEELFD